MPHASSSGFRTLPPYAPLPAHPMKATLAYGFPSAADELCIKQWLSNRLRDLRSAMPHMPGGFPFHYSVDGRGRGSLSYRPYEFYQEVPSSVLSKGGPPRRYWVKFSFTNHTDSDYDKSTDRCRRIHPSCQRKSYMSWRAYITVLSSSEHTCLFNLPLLHIELDPAVLNTPYGHFFKNDPSVILRAMRVSVDKGMPVTIKLADFSCPKEILFFGTDTTGQRHLLHTSNLRIPKSID
ncbi:hypothetical protein MSAN_01573000 [Mycena sanguinolenta]|uniref:Uncharacterized protein n=1 Tax=Mycena sanguinolenta TaxID=230812 RepID=A0A8H6Y3R3_9AGAR|nr:hypothetical protein MSAN_01573000 [Mycena sanguinolenta]